MKSDTVDSWHLECEANLLGPFCNKGCVRSLVESKKTYRKCIIYIMWDPPILILIYIYKLYSNNSQFFVFCNLSKADIIIQYSFISILPKTFDIFPHNISTQYFYTIFLHNFSTKVRTLFLHYFYLRAELTSRRDVEPFLFTLFAIY